VSARGPTSGCGHPGLDLFRPGPPASFSLPDRVFFLQPSGRCPPGARPKAPFEGASSLYNSYGLSVAKLKKIRWSHLPVSRAVLPAEMSIKE